MLAIVPDDLADALAAESRPSPNRIGARGKAQQSQGEVVASQVLEIAVI